MDEVHIKTSPPTPLRELERGDKVQLYRGDVKLYIARLRNAIQNLNQNINNC